LQWRVFKLSPFCLRVRRCHTHTAAYIAKAFYDSFAIPLQRNGFYERVVADAKKGSSANVWDSFKNLENSLKHRCSNWSTTVCPLVISIDEVHVLYNRRMDIGSDGQGSAGGLVGLRRGLTRQTCRGTSPVNLANFFKGIGAEMDELHPHKF